MHPQKPGSVCENFEGDNPAISEEIVDDDRARMQQATSQSESTRFGQEDVQIVDDIATNNPTAAEEVAINVPTSSLAARESPVKTTPTTDMSYLMGVGEHDNDQGEGEERGLELDQRTFSQEASGEKRAQSENVDDHQPVQEAQLAEEQHLEAEDVCDSDSAIGSDVESGSTSLSESIYNYRREHGRTYHAYKDGKYIFPNDEREADRLDLQHHIFRLTFGNRLFFAPLQNPKHCLDIGTGTGIWAEEFAEDFPFCQVIGIDLSPGQPTLVPPNLKFMIDDAEDLWLYAEAFDFIHARLMAGCFADWPNFFRQAYQNLEPGGWLEVQDYGLPVKSSDGTHTGTDLHRWGQLLCEASMKLGRPLGSDCSDYYVQWMQDAGFVDIQVRMFMWPSCGWPKDPYMKEIGRWNQVNILDGLEGFCLALLTRGLGWKKEEVDVLVAKVSNDLRNRKIHAYFPMPVVFGRRPFEREATFH
ncbi:S-adenosyl-L-methionine-dependent methyltransferase [Hortaea werneckii]|nr:S-adenosyl-L-methionine-dependent methyltransferase [Hortaea werneckii]KAI6871921.1 S-adenosyl-L-methionine-dependent methyltransferase [Hortaea werneckii]